MFMSSELVIQTAVIFPGKRECAHILFPSEPCSFQASSSEMPSVDFKPHDSLGEHALKASSCQSALASVVDYLSYTKPERRK